MTEENTTKAAAIAMRDASIKVKVNSAASAGSGLPSLGNVLRRRVIKAHARFIVTDTCGPFLMV